MGYLEDAFQEIAYDFPILGPSADILYRDASADTLVPGYGLVSGTTSDKVQSASSGMFYTAVSIATAAFSDGPFAYFTMRKLSAAATLARFSPHLALGAIILYGAGAGHNMTIQQRQQFNLHRYRSR